MVHPFIHSVPAVQRTLNRTTFQQLRNLLQQMGQPETGHQPIFLTEEWLITLMPLQATGVTEFTLFVSSPFSVLLLGRSKVSEVSNFEVEITFDPSAIGAFLDFLNQQPQDALILKKLEMARSWVQPNDPVAQSEFTLRLVEVLAGGVSEGNGAYPPVCRPVEEALRQQVEQERLLNQVSAQIRQSLELPVILETAVQQVRPFLAVDRLMIYQFMSDTDAPPEEVSGGYGQITHEARSSDEISSVLHWTEGDLCFIEVQNCRDKYRRGLVQAIDDVEVAYPASHCLLKFLRQMQVRAKLIVPIVVQGHLWGLLIAHQCDQPRMWQEAEKLFLQQVARQLEIAIYQAELYIELQQEKEYLEQRVIRRTQELYDAVQTAEAASKAKSDFLAAMSHELKTPLTCILGMSETLLRWSFGELSERQRRYIQIIHDSGDHLLALISDILDLTQVEAGKTVLRISQFSLTRLAQQSIHTLQEMANRHEVEVVTEVKINLQQDSFSGDRRRIRQILLNLLSNAIKFTPEGGTVTLRAWLEKTTVVFQVEDTGIGISEDKKPLLFNKFQQLSSSYDREYEGTGLGLALTKQLVDLHGGSIEVESKVGVGSVFTVRLPAQSVESSDSGSRNNLIAAPDKGQIVLIEEREEDATLICDLLTSAQYQVVWIVEGTTAIRQIDVLKPILVITAMQLSGSAGSEIITLLRQSPSTRGMKILALTDRSLTPEQLADLNADDYLQKPFQAEQLISRVTALLGSRTPIRLANA